MTFSNFMDARIELLADPKIHIHGQCKQKLSSKEKCTISTAIPVSGKWKNACVQLSKSAKIAWPPRYYQLEWHCPGAFGLGNSQGKTTIFR